MGQRQKRLSCDSRSAGHLTKKGVLFIITKSDVLYGTVLYCTVCNGDILLLAVSAENCY